MLTSRKHWQLTVYACASKRADAPLMFSEQQLEKLIDASLAVMKNAYCPYSRFPVGAALLTKDGTMFTGA